MIEYLEQIVFIIIFSFFVFLIFRRSKTIYRNIFIGKKEYKSFNNKSEKIKNVLLLALGQKKMFKKIIPAVLHFLIYVGFILINIEVLEIILDGVFGTHRVFASIFNNSYNYVISFFEFLAILVIISCVFFLTRRNLLKIDRFQKVELFGWPNLDANIILIAEIILMVAILTMNAADLSLQSINSTNYTKTGLFIFSNSLTPLLSSYDENQLIFIERTAWWIHIVGIFSFALYVTYSKHLHIFLAFPNTYHANNESLGKMKNMPEITSEINMMLGITNNPEVQEQPTNRFGAKDISDLSWKNLLDAYSCTECGRCTEECPANLTGKKLSPRKIMMDTRDRAEEYGEILDKNKNPDIENFLLDSYITREEINACTSCNACTEACPININPLEIILELRRYVALEESKAPNEWNMMFQNIETNFSPWKFPIEDRFKWNKENK
tara:strand:+ start:4001 stop:5320 length:1320 start_codon:yes stop_codon:yes gene_type:complete